MGTEALEHNSMRITSLLPARRYFSTREFIITENERKLNIIVCKLMHSLNLIDNGNLDECIHECKYLEWPMRNHRIRFMSECEHK